MDPTYFAQYRGFEFQCSPQRLAVNAFVPRLIVHDPSESVTVEVPLEAPSVPFTDPTSAAHQAFALGRQWVDDGYEAAAAAARNQGPQLLQGSEA